ncbi:MAG: hypothetical protein ACPG8W_08610 [Candidatus Promineifilaceae bacterium]
MEALLKLLGVRRRNQEWLTFLVVLLLFILTFLLLRSCVGGNVQGNRNALTVRQPVLPNGAVVGQEFPFRGTFQGTEAVELYLNGERIGRTRASRNGDWQLSSSISKPGIYSLQAIGTDSSGKEIKSSRYPIEIYPARTFDSFGEVNNLHNIIGGGNGAGNNAMNVARFGSGVPLIDEALNGLTIAPGRFFLTGSGTPDSRVFVTNNGEPLGTVQVNNSGRWRTNVSLLNEGKNHFEASNADVVGLSSSTADVRVANPAKAPTIGIVRDGDISTVNLRGRGEVGDTLLIHHNDTEVGTALVSDFGTWSLTDVPLADGDSTNVFTASVLDDAGEIAATSPPVTLNVRRLSGDGNDDAGSSAGSTVDVVALTLQASADGDVADLSGTGKPDTTLRIMQNGEEVDTADVDSDGEWSLAGVTLENGENRFVAEGEPDGDAIPVSNFAVIDFAGNMVSVPPTLQASANDDVADLNGTGEPDTTLRIMQNGEEIDTADVDSDGEWSLTGIALEDGENMFVAEGEPDGDATLVSNVVVIDFAGNTVSAPPTLQASANGNVADLSGTGEPDTTLRIIRNGQEVDTVDVDSDGEWSLADVDLESGENEFWAEAITGDDVVTSAPVIVNGAAMVGEVTINTPEYDADAVTLNSAGIPIGAIAFSGTGLPADARVVIVYDDEEAGETTVDDEGEWAFSAELPLNPGEHTAHALIFDEDGEAVESDPVTFAGIDQVGELSVIFVDNANGEEGDGNETTGEAASAASDLPVVELILDASWSMTFPLDSAEEADRLTANNPDSRFAIARNTLVDIVDSSLVSGQPIGLRVFGNLRGDLECQTDIMIPVSPLNKEATTDLLRRTAPQYNANTAIAASLAGAANDLDGIEGDITIVLLTDGQETCEGDVAAEIEALREAGINVTIDVVGFAILDDELRAEFETWAELGGGTYYDARDGEALAQALTSTLQASFLVENASGEVVARGGVGSTVELPVGQYTVRVGNQSYDVEVTVEGSKVVVK